MESRLLIVLLFTFLVGIEPAQAALIVTINPATLTEGGSPALVDVLIESDSADSLVGFDYEFLLQTPDSVVEFDVVQPLPYAVMFPPYDYVFLDNSFNASTNKAQGKVPDGNVLRDTFVGGDSTLDGFPELIGSQPLLLARLQIKADSDVLAQGGTLTLLPNSSFYFFDEEFNLVQVPFTSTPGTITVLASPDQNGGVIPEPASLSIFALGGIALLVTQSRRRFCGRRS